MIKETHPFLELGKLSNATKLILGSFPVYSITLPDTEEKIKIRKSNGTAQFFYGSCYSSFWRLYHLYIDNDLQIPFQLKNALSSLSKNQIAISDMILECERNGKSALDSDLKKRIYNTNMLIEYLDTGVTNILTTSKGVMEMFHEKVAKKSNRIIFLEEKSKKWQEEIISNLNGDDLQIKKLFCRQYLFDGKTISLLSIPSPGSPQRQLKLFGYSNGEWREYANKYFEYAFKWLNKS
jgi:G:T/U-mismatch repair DNA glycosylase